ncbi:UNVERIFIED_CONTAM: hypothetical protein NCL1_33259 [Trichonephila clavipes]
MEILFQSTREITYTSSSSANPTSLAHADTQRDNHLRRDYHMGCKCEENFEKLSDSRERAASGSSFNPTPLAHADNLGEGHPRRWGALTRCLNGEIQPFGCCFEKMMIKTNVTTT